MPKEYSEEELWKLYEKLPQELQEAIFSVENARHIREICKRNEIEDKTSELAKQAGYVLLGVLPPEDFREYLEQELGKETAKRVSHEINRFIFFSVKHSLAELYKPVEEEKPAEAKPGPKAPAAPEKEDIYRETME